MTESLKSSGTGMWPKGGSVYLEIAAIILLAIVSMSLQHNRIDFGLLLSPQLGVRIIGSLCVWFGNKFVLDRILQSRIDSNKVSKFLPFEMTVASIAVTSIIYIVFYPILLYQNGWSFVWAKFFKGLFITSGLSLFIVIFYAGLHIWNSWWSDGEFIFGLSKKEESENEWKDFITIENSRETVNINLNEVGYFLSEFKVVFLVDASGKKWITQYNLSELENSLDDRFFRLNRRALVSRPIISHVKKLPNHRLLVTIGDFKENHTETISRYKSTRFKQWLQGA